jgi:hypothetical protein
MNFQLTEHLKRELRFENRFISVLYTNGRKEYGVVVNFFPGCELNIESWKFVPSYDYTFYKNDEWNYRFKVLATSEITAVDIFLK